MKRLLIIDDSKDYLDSLENALRNEYEILKAPTLTKAKEIAAKERLDIALIDIRLSEEDMSNRDGLIFLEWLKMNCPNVHAIVMSAYREFDLAVEALNLGAAYFLKKPINLMELKGILNTVEEKSL